MLKPFTLISVGLLLSTISLSAQGQPPEKNEMRIAKSVFIYLARTKDSKIDQYNFAYLPAGTWIKFLGKNEDYNGKKRFLILSEDGVYGYITDDGYWNKYDILNFSKIGHTAIFNKDYDHTAKVNENFKYILSFTRGEVWPVVEKEIDSIKISVDLSKKLLDNEGKPLIKLDVKTKAILEISVPNNIVRTIDFEDEKVQKAIQFRPIFKQSILQTISGIEKPCNTSKSRAMQANVSGGLDLKKFFITIGFSAEAETKEIEEFPKDRNVRRIYYIRGDLESGQQINTSGIYRLTQYKNCITNHYEFSFLRPDSEEVFVTKDWAQNNNLDLDTATGKIKVTCPSQYFKFEEALTAQGFTRDEVTFLISLIGRWRDLATGSCS